jgi:hypothetical protein
LHGRRIEVSHDPELGMVNTRETPQPAFYVRVLRPTTKSVSQGVLAEHEQHKANGREQTQTGVTPVSKHFF